VKVRPLGDRVVVRPIQEQEGIIIQAGNRKPVYGKVLAVGPGRLELGSNIKMSIEVGDRVLYAKDAGTEIPGSDCLMMREYEIFGVVEVAQ
jgi:chaperonin GroES